MRPRRWLAAVALFLGGANATAACGDAHAPARPTLVPRAATAGSDAAPDASGASDSGAPPALPSGHYVITTEVTRDTCGDSAAPAPVTAFVQMKVWHGHLTGNFPLPVPAPTPAAARNYSTLRSDILLFPRNEPAKPVSILGVGSKCLDYETKTDYRVESVTERQVRIRYTREFGDASHCPPNRKLPAHCALDYVYTFALQTPLCDATCGVSFRKSDAGAIAECDCH